MPDGHFYEALPDPNGPRSPHRRGDVDAGYAMTLRELVLACRERVPKILDALDRIIDDEDAPYAAKILASSMLLDRAYGKPRQVVKMDPGLDRAGEPVRVYIPDNNRHDLDRDVMPATIDENGEEDEDEPDG